MLCLRATKPIIQKLSSVQRQAKLFISTSCTLFAPERGDEESFAGQKYNSVEKIVEDDFNVQNLETSSENKTTADYDDLDRSRDEYVFDRNFRFLKTGVNYSSFHDALQLAYLPLVSYRAYRETVFVEQLCHLWWTAFEPHITTQPIGPGDLVNGTLFGLKKINESTQGSLSKVLAWNSIFTVSDCVLKSVLRLSPKNFDIYLFSMWSFLQYGHSRIRNEDKVELKKQLNETFPVYLSAALNGKLNSGHYITQTITKSAFRLQAIGIDKPADQCLEDLVFVFSRVVNEMEHSLHFVYIRDLHFMALVLLRWNIDANVYNGIFWCKWYENMVKHYNELNLKIGFYNAMVLTDWLLVALKFDQEKEFLKILPVWLDGFRMNRHLLYRENIEFLINQTKKKYSNDPLRRIDERSLTNILKVLQGLY